ncbi:hypothetical protein NPIL_3591 [Nephila pilipes]|uniref:Uncharacterized protein n=1 Tax=Nephila pilipes TaxID=299642 RepID=A0A8X6NLE4_NEPPI|nr:hypothetical protein NPIL_3591 [Nephila pilipes]
MSYGTNASMLTYAFLQTQALKNFTQKGGRCNLLRLNYQTINFLPNKEPIHIAGISLQFACNCPEVKGRRKRECLNVARKEKGPTTPEIRDDHEAIC